MSINLCKDQTVNVRIDAKLRNYLKSLAAEKQRSLRSLTEELLVEGLGDTSEWNKGGDNG